MHRLSAFLFALALPFLLPSGSAAVSPSTNSQELEKEIAGLDRTAARPAGERAVIARIERDFAFPPGRVRALRQQGAGYGEIVVLLALARALPGGTRPENIDRVRSLRTGPPAREWTQTARELSVDLGEIVSQLRQVRKEALLLMEQGAPKGQQRRPDLSGEGKSLPRGRAAD